MICKPCAGGADILTDLKRAYEAGRSVSIARWLVGESLHRQCIPGCVCQHRGTDSRREVPGG